MAGKKADRCHRGLTPQGLIVPHVASERLCSLELLVVLEFLVSSRDEGLLQAEVAVSSVV